MKLTEQQKEKLFQHALATLEGDIRQNPEHWAKVIAEKLGRDYVISTLDLENQQFPGQLLINAKVCTTQAQVEKILDGEPESKSDPVEDLIERLGESSGNDDEISGLQEALRAVWAGVPTEKTEELRKELEKISP